MPYLSQVPGAGVGSGGGFTALRDRYLDVQRQHQTQQALGAYFGAPAAPDQRGILSQMIAPSQPMTREQGAGYLAMNAPEFYQREQETAVAQAQAQAKAMQDAQAELRELMDSGSFARYVTGGASPSDIAEFIQMRAPGNPLVQQYANAIAGADEATITKLRKQAAAVTESGPDATPSSVKEYEYMNSLPASERERFMALKRALPQVPSSVIKETFEADEEAEGSRVMSGRLNELASRFDTLKPTAGASASFSELMKQFTGEQDAVTMLRKDYNMLKGKLVVENLPPGAASDTDIALALAGFLPDNADPKTMASFLRGLSKISSVQSRYNEFKSEYLSENSSPRGLTSAWRQYMRDNENEFSMGNETDEFGL